MIKNYFMILYDILNTMDEICLKYNFTILNLLKLK